MLEETNFEYYYGNQAEQFSFIRIPKAFFTNKNFSVLTYGSKILYGILLDRMSLSIKNKWLDSENKVFIYFTIDSIQNELNCSRPTAVSLLQELEQIGLVEKKRQPNKPTMLYIKNFVLAESKTRKETTQNQGSKKSELPEVKDMNYRKLKDLTTGSKKNELPEVKNFNSNNTEYSNTESLESSSAVSDITEDILNSLDEEEIDKIVPEELKKCMCNILKELLYASDSRTQKYIIGGKTLTRDEVRQKIFSILDTNNFIAVSKAVLDNPNPIMQMRSFIITCFYNIATGVMRLPDASFKQTKNDFNNFQQNNYDFTKLEEALRKTSL